MTGIPRFLFKGFSILNTFLLGSPGLTGFLIGRLEGGLGIPETGFLILATLGTFVPGFGFFICANFFLILRNIFTPN